MSLHPRSRLVLFATLTALVSGLLTGPAAAGHKPHGPKLDFRGEATLPAGAGFQGTVVGGLSSLTYDKARDVYYAISDDQGAGFTPNSTPARFYTLRIDLADGTLDPGDVTVVDVTTLRGPDGQPFPALSLDPEGLTLTRDDTLIVTSEGIPARDIAPFVREFDLSGQQVRELAVPAYYAPSGGTRGVRRTSASRQRRCRRTARICSSAPRTPLCRTGPPPRSTTGSPARLLRYHLKKPRLDREYVYQTDPVAEPDPGLHGQRTGRAAAPEQPFLLAMERSFSVGAGNTIRIYRVSPDGRDGRLARRRPRPARAGSGRPRSRCSSTSTSSA